MVAASKVFPEEFSRLSCRHFCHPWTKSCLLNMLYILYASFIGSVKFFSFTHFCQYLIEVIKKGKQKSNKSIKERIKALINDIISCGSLVPTCTFGFSCLFRNLLGKYTYLTIVCLPSVVSGLIAVYLMNEKSRHFYCFTWYNVALEIWLRSLQEKKKLTWTITEKTFVFMFFSSLLSYLFQKDIDNQHYYWFFLPSKTSTEEKNEKSICYHPEDCSKFIVTSFFKYFSTGFLLQFLKSVVSNFKQPKSIISELMTLKFYKLAGFLGLYVAIYQSTRCFLYRRKKIHSPVHDVIAGFLSGIAYHIEPSITIMNTAVVTIAQILTRIGCNQNLIPRMPYKEIIFAYCCGYLFHKRYFDPQQIPKVGLFILDTVTNHSTAYVVQNYRFQLRKMVGK